jgi:hypothetical protein
VTSEAAPNSSQSNQIKSNQIKSNQIKSNQIKSNQIKSNQIKSNQIKSNQIKSKQIKSKQILARMRRRKNITAGGALVSGSRSRVWSGLLEVNCPTSPVPSCYLLVTVA